MEGGGDYIESLFYIFLREASSLPLYSKSLPTFICCAFWPSPSSSVFRSAAAQQHHRSLHLRFTSPLKPQEREPTFSPETALSSFLSLMVNGRIHSLTNCLLGQQQQEQQQHHHTATYGNSISILSSHLLLTIHHALLSLISSKSPSSNIPWLMQQLRD